MDPSSQFITTASGSRVHRSCRLMRPDNLSLGGRVTVSEQCAIHADRARVTIGSKVQIGAGTVLKPGQTLVSATAAGESGLAAGSAKSAATTSPPAPAAFEPLVVGDGAVIGPGCTVEARYVGQDTVIEEGCIIGPRCVIHDGSRVLAGSVLSPDTTIAPCSIACGVPAVVIGRLAIEQG